MREVILEEVNNFSLLEQRNGSFGMGEVFTQNNSESVSKNTNSNLENLMNSRSLDMKNFSK